MLERNMATPQHNDHRLAYASRRPPLSLYSLFDRARSAGSLIKLSVSAWIDDGASSMGAAIAYYTIFSIAPLLVIAMAVAGWVFGADAVQGEVAAQLRSVIGTDAARAVQDLIAGAAKPAESLAAAGIGAVLLIVGATTVFAELQSALDHIWQVPALQSASGWWSVLRSRLLSFGVILALGFLLLVSLLASAAIAAFGSWWSTRLAGWEVMLHLLNTMTSLGLSIGLFAMIYKLMPRARIAWRDVWIGAGVTALLFEAGKLLIGLYVGKSGVASSFGAAGSLVVLLVWVYYSAQIFLLGAEFTWVYSHHGGSRAGQPLPPPVGSGAGRSRAAL
jgi:membrane protein